MSFPPLSTPLQQPLSPLLPSPLPSPSTSNPPRNNDPQDHQPYPSIPPPPPNFQPLFTLLSNSRASTTHHPTVHYIFTDDTPDRDPITAAALHILHASSSTTSSSPNASPGHGRAGTTGRDVTERYVLLEMDGTGTKIESAQSMAPDWAVTSTELGPAPTWDGDGEGKRGGGEGRGLMLRIEGVEVGGKEEEAGKLGEGKRLEELVEVYERQMAELRRVVDAGQGITTGGESGR